MLRPCLYSYGQRPADRAERSVQRQLTHDHVALEGLCWDLPIGGEDAEGQRQIIGRALLPKVGRAHVDHEALAGELIAAGLDGGDDAVLTLLDGGIGEPDELEVAAGRAVDFDRHRPRLDTLQGGGKGAYEHGIYIRYRSGATPRRCRP